MLKILHFADLHLDAPFRQLGAERGALRRQGVRLALERIVALAHERHVDYITCGGDLYEDDRISPDTEAFLARTFAAAAPIPVFIAPGNHDWYGHRSAYRRISWSGNVSIFDTDRLSPRQLAPGLTLWGAAHLRKAGTESFVRDFRVAGDGIHIGLFHASVSSQFMFQESGKQVHAPCTDEEIQASGLTHALLGHFHRPALKPLYTYPGNPDPLTFGEDGDRGAVLCTIHEDGRIDREVLPVAQSRVADVTVDLTGIVDSTEVVSRVSAAVASLTGDVRISLRGDIPPDVSIDATVLRSIAGPQSLSLGTTVLNRSYDLDRLRELPTIQGQFVRDVLADPELQEDERRRILLTGLRVLDGRKDLEVDV